jgi:hypothetical protein
MPFFMLYLREMKNEAIEILLPPVCKLFLTDRRCSLDDLSSLSDEEIILFKELL